jgi:putative Ca2+/H+ antiporter (TMEM165/GDT1 family)
MKANVFLTVFSAIFIAELGDKTQLATLLFAADQESNKFTVFLAAAIALVLTSAIGVIAGSFLSQYVNATYLRLIAGIGFIGIGIWTLLTA